MKPPPYPADPAATSQSTNPQYNFPAPHPHKILHLSKNPATISNQRKQEPHNNNPGNGEEDKSCYHGEVLQHEFGVGVVLEGIELVQFDITNMGEIV